MPRYTFFVALLSQAPLDATAERAREKCLVYRRKFCCWALFFSPRGLLAAWPHSPTVHAHLMGRSPVWPRENLENLIPCSAFSCMDSTFPKWNGSLESLALVDSSAVPAIIRHHQSHIPNLTCWFGGEKLIQNRAIPCACCLNELSLRGLCNMLTVADGPSPSEPSSMPEQLVIYHAWAGGCF